jgi:hypothetical protein
MCCAGLTVSPDWLGSRRPVPRRPTEPEQRLVSDQRPANLRNKVVIGNSIYQQQGRGKNKKLVKMYTLAHQAKQPADVPFSEDFKTVISGRINAYFLPRIVEAMATRR